MAESAPEFQYKTAKYIIEKYLNTTDIYNYKFENIYYNPKGAGYMGNITYVTVVDTDTEKKMNLVVKSAYDCEKLRQQFPISTFFLNEIFFYEKVLPALKSAIHFDFISDALYCSKEAGKEGIVLQNLTSQGFSCLSKDQEYDETHLELLMKTYGQLHACSFILKRDNLQKYLALIADWGESSLRTFKRYPSFTKLSDTVKKLCELGLSYLDDKTEESTVKKFKYITENPAEVLLNVYNTMEPISIDCVVHGDCWPNNVLFKYEEINGKFIPVDVRLIDFQYAKFGTPIFDLSYSLYAGAPKEELEKFKYYLLAYCHELNVHLNEAGFKPIETYKPSELYQDWKEFSRYGMIMSFIGIKSKSVPANEVRDLSDVQTKNPTSQNKPFLPIGFDEVTFKRRMRYIILHMYKSGGLS